MSPRRTRITDEQTEDQSFLSELEFNDFFGQVVITGTEGTDDTELTTLFDNYLPGRGIFVGSDGNVVTTGTNTVTIEGFRTEFVSASGSLQVQIDGIGGGGDVVNSITASGVTITGAVTLASIEGIDLIPDIGTSTITISGTASEGGSPVDPEEILHIYEGTGGQSVGSNTAITFDTADVVEASYSFIANGSEVTFNVDGDFQIHYDLSIQALSGGTGGGARSNADSWLEINTGSGFTEVPGTRGKFYIRGSVFGASASRTKILTVSNGDIIRVVANDTAGSAPQTIQPDGASLTIRPARAQGPPGDTGPQGPPGQDGEDGGVVDITASGTTISGSVIFEGAGNVSLGIQGQTITISGSGGSGGGGITDINGETGPSISLVGAGSTTVTTTAANTIEIESVGEVPDAIVAGNNIVVTSGSNFVQIDSFTDDDVDSITASGVTVTGAIELFGIGGTVLFPELDGPDTITISGAPVDSAPPQGELQGQIVQIEFTSGSSDEWMAISSENNNSDEHPYVFPFPATIIATTFTNKNENVNVDIEFYKALAGAGASNTQVGTWDINNARVARKSDYPTVGPTISFDEGDKLAVFAAKAGGNEAQQQVVAIYVQINSNLFEEAVESFSGNF